MGIWKRINGQMKYFDTDEQLKLAEGGQGSGNFGHAGRPGEVGGSGEGGDSKVVQIGKLHVKRENFTSPVRGFNGEKKTYKLGQKYRKLGREMTFVGTTTRIIPGAARFNRQTGEFLPNKSGYKAEVYRDDTNNKYYVL